MQVAASTYSGPDVSLAVAHLVVPGHVGDAIRAGTFLKSSHLLASEVPSNTCSNTVAISVRVVMV
jgi:hypothetical protein